MAAQPAGDLSSGLSQLLEEFTRQKREYENTKIKCGLVGRSGVGKSSLINAITGEKLAPVGFGKETTVAPHSYTHGGLELVDLPGCGTERFPTSTFVEALQLRTYDFFIFLTELRFFQDDKTVFSQISQQLGKPCFLVRNKFDQALADAAYDEANLTEAQVREQIERNMRENLRPLTVDKVYMVSARRPAHYDLPQLLDDVRSSFVGMKRIRLDNDLTIWSANALAAKRENAMRITTWYAGAAALNGLNPIPGLDVSVDLGLLKKLSNEIARIYSLTKEQEDYWRGMLKGPHGQAVMQKAFALTLKYGTEAAITSILRAVGRTEIPKVFAKFIPVAGQMFASVAGAGLTYRYGKNLVDEYHEMAEQLLQELSRD